ncbi:MAG: hypothetical protein AAF668_09555 [Pseudomonadota bacterium]
MSGDDKKPARPIALFAVITTFIVAAAILIIFIGFGFDAFDGSVHVKFALFLGVAGTIGVAVGLMALAFHSARSGHDDEIGPFEP